jgi:hypothetical protein
MRLVFHVRMRWKLKDTLNGITNPFSHFAIVRILIPHSKNVFTVSNAHDGSADFALLDTWKLTSNQSKENFMMIEKNAMIRTVSCTINNDSLHSKRNSLSSQ